MSFGGAGGQGVVRYALMFDSTQAVQSVKTFQNNLAQLGAGTSKIQSNIQAFTAQLSKQSTAFTAGINPIKAQGTALTGLTNNLKTHATQITSVGTKIKDTASKFAGFATGLSATASGVLQLGAGFRDYSDAQIAVERVTRKNSLAHEALTKAQDKLNALTSKGVKSGKEYQQAQLDVSQAQSQVSIQTQLLGEAQERMFDSQTQFVASVIPTTLGALGTLGSAYKDLGLNTSKLKGVFTGLGGGIKSTVIPAIAGLVGSGGLGGLGDKIKEVTGSVGGFKSSLVGIALPAALGGTAALLFLEDVNASMDKLQKVGLGMQRTSSTLFDTKSIDQMKLSTAQLQELLSKTGATMLELRLAPEGVAKRFKEAGGQIDKFGNIVVTTVKKVSDLGSAFSASSQDYIKWSTNMLNAGKSEKEVTDFLLGSHIKLIDVLKIESAAMAKHSQLSQEQLNIMSRQKEAAQQQKQWVIDLNAAWQQTLLTTKASADDAKRQVDGLNQWNEAIKKTIPNMIAMAGGAAGVLDTMKLVNDTVKLSKDRLVEWNPAANASTEIMSTIDDVLAGLPAKQATWTNSINANSKALEDAKKKLDDFKKGLESAQTNIKGVFKIDSNADKILKNLIKALPNKAEKEIKLKLKFGQSIDDNKKAFNDLLFEATQVSDKTADASAKQIIETIDKKFKGAKGSFAGLRTALQTAIADPNTPDKLKTLLMNFDWESIGVKGNQGIQKGINSTPLTAEVKISIAGFLQGGKSRFSGTDAGSRILGALGLTTEQLKITLPPPVIPKPVTTAFDTGVATLKTNVADISKTVPTISVINSKALKGVGVIAQHIEDLAKLKPVAQLVNSKALKAVGVIAQHIDDLAKIKPTLQVQNSKALKAVDVIANRIQDLAKLSPTVHVGISGPGASFSKGDTSISSKGDTSTSGLFVGGNKSNSNSNSGGGDTIIENHIHIGDENLLRKFTARSGRNRFTMGA